MANTTKTNTNTTPEEIAARLTAATKAHAAAWEQYESLATLVEKTNDSRCYYTNAAARAADAAKAAALLDEPAAIAAAAKTAHDYAAKLAKAAETTAYYKAALTNARAALLDAEKELVAAQAAAKGQQLPITAANLYDRAAMIAYVALRTAEMGSKIKRGADGTTKGGGNTGAQKQVMRTKMLFAQGITNARTADAYIARRCNDYDDLHQETALELVAAIADGADQQELYRRAFAAAHRWIYANRVRPAAKHLYIMDAAGNDVDGWDVIDVTAGIAHMVNHVEESTVLANVKAALKKEQWDIIVLTAKGNSAAQIGQSLDLTAHAVAKKLENARAIARRLYPDITTYTQLIDTDDISNTLAYR